MKNWKTLSKEVILDFDRFLKVENHTIELPDGRILKKWSWVITPDFINVLAVTQEGKFVCFRQTKYAVEGTSLAPVGGYIEQGEAPLSAAQRELLEETGYQASQWHQLGGFPADANRGCGNGYFFLALGARKVSEPDRDDLEEMEIQLLSRKELENAVGNGEFRVVPWMLSVLLALRFLEEPGS